MTLSIDHISYASRDLLRSKQYFWDRFGLDAVEGGSHPEWGTANLIVPLGRHFIEIVGVVDADVAARNPVGQIVAARAAGGDRPLGLCLRSDDLDAEAKRLGLRLLAGERRYADGRILRWRQMGIAEALAKPGLPYFFEYSDDDLRLGARAAKHALQPLGIDRIRCEIDRETFSRWTAGTPLPVDFLPGTAGLAAIDIAMADGSQITVGTASEAP